MLGQTATFKNLLLIFVASLCFQGCAKIQSGDDASISDAGGAGPNGGAAEDLSTKIIKVGAGEYCTSYVTNQGKVLLVDYNDSKLRYEIKDLGLSDIVDIDGAQYTNIVMNKDGGVFIVGFRQANGKLVNTVPTDSTGAAFVGNSKVYGWWQSYLTLRNGKIWMWGLNDFLNINGGAAIAKPRQLTQPTGKTFTKLVMHKTNVNIVMALASDGTVWQYRSDTVGPVKVNFTGVARDIASLDSAGLVIETATDLLGWGYLATYLGLSSIFLNTPTSIKAQFVAIGADFPTKQLIGNSGTLHFIDQNNDMYAIGDNVQGEIGDGNQWKTWRTYLSPTVVAPYAWNWGHSQLLQGATKIPGKFKNIQTSNTITFYLYAQDMGNNWYSWGRNKATSLGNGITLNSNDSSAYPNFQNVPAPTLVTPLTQEWVIWNHGTAFGPSTFDKNAVHAPIANAGVNQYLSAGTNRTTLYGSGSSQQEFDIATYQWSKVSGPNNPTIVSDNAENTSVTGLIAGTYVFNLVVTNNRGLSANSDVTVKIAN